MTTHLYLAPAGHGKTEHVTRRIREVQANEPLAPIYAIFPNQNQVHAFRDRLSAKEGSFGITLGTFYTFYPHILGLAGRLQPSLPEPVQYRLLRQAVEDLTDRGDLPHFAELRNKPGFVVVLRTLVEEFKRASIGRDEFVQAVESLPQPEPRLVELTKLYAYYQDWLLDNGWADTEGQGWLAALNLQRDKKLCSDLRLLVVDGFDEFTPNQLEVLGLLTARSDETVVTLTGDVTNMEQGPGEIHARPAWRRFLRALGHIQRVLKIEPEPLPVNQSAPSGASLNKQLCYLEASLFEAQPVTEAAFWKEAGESHPRHLAADDAPAIQLTEAQNRAEEARAALRWVKERLVHDGLSPQQVAIIGRDIGPYRLFLEETAVEFNLPIHVGEGLSLATNPAVAALFSLLLLPLEFSQDEGNWATRPLFDVLRNPYLQDVAPDINGRDVLRLEAIARRARVVAGLDQWHDALTDWVAYITNKAEQAAALEERNDDVEAGAANPQIMPAEAEALQTAFANFTGRIARPSTMTVRGYAAFIESLIGDEPTTQSQTTAVASDDSTSATDSTVAEPTLSELTLSKPTVETQPTGIAARAALSPATARRDLAALRTFKEILRSVVLATDSLKPSDDASANDSPVDDNPVDDSISEGKNTAGRALTYVQFIQDLIGSVQGAIYYPPTVDQPNAAVPVLSILNARGLSFRAVAIIGLAEGDFPRGEREDILLWEEDRQRLREAGLRNLETRLHGDEISFFYQAVTRATEKLLLTRPYLADDGEAWEPSPYWQEVCRLLNPPIHHIRTEDPLELRNVASRTELMRLLSRQTQHSSVGMHDELASFPAVEVARVLRNAAILRARLDDHPSGLFEGDLTAMAPHLSQRYSRDHVWSSSRLEAYGLCPLHFWLGQDLMLEARQPPQDGFDVFILGNIYHEMLEDIYNKVDGPADAEALLALLPDIAKTVFDNAPQKYGFRPSPLWSMQRHELEQIMARTLAALAEATAELTPMVQEQVFGLEDKPPLVVKPTRKNDAQGDGDQPDDDIFQVRGFIDRIDQDAEGNLHIIDYKSGSAAIRGVDLEEGRRLQIALYALAARDALSLGKIEDGFYWHVGSAKPSSLALRKFEGGADAALQTVIDHTFAHVRGVRSGQFPPTPPSSGCPSHCPGASFCWRYKPKAF